MSRWVIPGAGFEVVIAVAAVAGVVWVRSGDTSAVACDHAALVASMHAAISAAEHDGAESAVPRHVEGCTPDDMMQSMMEVSRSWHVMPDGTIMRAGRHRDP
jgi:hypothetical protein